MDKKFVFIDLCIGGWGAMVNHGIAFLVPILKRHGYSIEYLYIDREIPPDDFERRVVNADPAIVGFSCTSHQLNYLAKYSRALEKHKTILQLAGGIGATLEPDWILSETSVAGVCIGDGEMPLDFLLRSIDEGRGGPGTPGFYWKVGNQIQKEAIPQQAFDLSKLDFPDYSLFEQRQGGGSEAEINIILTRGCPAHCSFCCNDALRDIFPSPSGYFRQPSVEYSIQLIEKTMAQYSGELAIHFQDDLLLANKKWFSDFAHAYQRFIRRPYLLNARADFITLDSVALLKRSGCKVISIGIETGNERLRHMVLGKKISNQSIIAACDMIKAQGIALYTTNIVGIPFEGMREIKETFLLNKTIKPDHAFCFFLYPYKHTAIYRMCEENDLLKSETDMKAISNIYTKPAIRMNIARELYSRYYHWKISQYPYTTTLPAQPFRFFYAILLCMRSLVASWIRHCYVAVRSKISLFTRSA